MFNRLRDIVLDFFYSPRVLQADENTPTACDPRLYKNGTCIGVYDAKGAVRFENLIRKVANESRRPVDWHFAAGRAVVLCFQRDVGRVLPILERELGPSGR